MAADDARGAPHVSTGADRDTLGPMSNTSDTGVAAFVNGVGGEPAIPSIRTEGGRRGGWYGKLVAHYLKRALIAQKAHPGTDDGDTAAQLARTAIRWACVKSALSGALAGSVSTGATIFTAETEGIGGIVAGPVAALAIGGEMIYRAILHVELTTELAAIFDVELDPNDDDDIWRVYALAFGTKRQDEGSADPGRDLVAEVTHLEGEQIGESIGQRVLGESVLRNIVPVLGIFASALTNYLMTRRLGDTVRRYMRYHHALDREGSHVSAQCRAHMDLLIEGLWFIFSADGKLTSEEAAFLGHMLKKLDPITRRATLARFVEDELDWTTRIKRDVPEEIRDAFMHLLEVAAAVDKEVGLPERKILRRAALALGREYSQERVERMIREFEESGVLSGHGPPARG
jgi:uncharacterized tellurite resistance protein B-like protein